ncbi:PLP-dependent aminotransferase family protein [Mucilaginibacter sp. OK098]|uniref:aminotransferase-like domain-containing protein n=1 Tax=Mucilaginibacter sp. OK098 TaxID=1855297 RepID=UPI001F33FDE4|nr:PLP-dependent aminotransferase family protein [Mucilaginibacter sp. OK098]
MPVYQQVANGLIRLIVEGNLQPGHSLPASRAFAQLMHLNRTTVVAAYEELRIQDWIAVVPRKGIFISSQLPLIKPKSFSDEISVVQMEESQPDYFLKLTTANPPSEEKFYEIVINDGYPDSRIAPLSLLLSKYKSLFSKKYLDGLLLRGTTTGSEYLRIELASFMSQTRGMIASKENILVTRGAQIAIYLAARMIIKPGSLVIVGDSNYFLANEVFTRAGAVLIKVKVDENGMDVDEIEKICKEKKPHLLYIIPHHHHPTTVTLSAERRMKLLQIIQKYRLPVIEDDYDYDFHYDNCPILPLASADHKGYVIYIGSITKTLAPSIKMGFIVANKSFIWQTAQFKMMMEIRGDVLMEEALAHLYNTGEMQRHIARSVKLYKSRRDLFCEEMSNQLNDMVTFTKPHGGMAIWTSFNRKYSLVELSSQLAKQGIYMNDGSRYAVGDTAGNSLRIGFASMNEKEMKAFVQALYNLK